MENEKQQSYGSSLFLLAAATIAAYAIRKYFTYSEWNGGKCRFCGRTIALHEERAGKKLYMCPGCDKIVCETE